MHIITDAKESKTFVKNMGQSLSDAEYWKNWYVLDITGSPDLDWIRQAKITTLVRAKLPDDDGTILWPDCAVTVVFHNEEKPNIASLEEALTAALGYKAVEIELLNVVQDNERTRTVLSHREGFRGDREAPAANYHFLKSLVPNIDDLLRNWNIEKKNRVAREKPAIMIVDDDPMVLRLAGRVLSRDYMIITAQNGAEAIAKHLQQMPDIIFLDIGLPDCDGLTLLNYMQQYDTDCRIVMFSADDFLKTRVSALAGGAKGFLPKPFNLPAFQRQIAAWFSGGHGQAGE